MKHLLAYLFIVLGLGLTFNVSAEAKNFKAHIKNYYDFDKGFYGTSKKNFKEANHGIFSYYLMKGLEGNADSNQDKKITNGELLAYMDENVSQKASELGRQQNPSLAGDPNKVLMSYR